MNTLPDGYIYTIDYDCGEATPIVSCTFNPTGPYFSSAKQIFHIPVEPSGNALPLSFNWQVNYKDIEINFIYRFGVSLLHFDRIFVVTKHASFSLKEMPTEAGFVERTNLLTYEEFNKLYDDCVFRINNNLPDMETVRRIYFYLIQQHEDMADKEIVRAVETLQSKLNRPNTTKSSLHRIWYGLNPQKMKDGTFQ